MKDARNSININGKKFIYLGVLLAIAIIAAILFLRGTTPKSSQAELVKSANNSSRDKASRTG